MNPLTYAGMGALVIGSASAFADPNAKYLDPPQALPGADKSQYYLFNPTPPSLLRQMNPLYESPYTVDAGHFQVESYAFQYVWDRNSLAGDDIQKDLWSVGPVTLKLGILNYLDAEVVLAPYTKIRYKDLDTRVVVTQSGFGDITPRVKLNLWGNDAASNAFGLIPFVKFPTSQDGLGNGSVEGGMVFPFSLQLPSDWWMILSPELDYMCDLSGSGHHFEFQNTAYFRRPITDKISGYVDFFSWVSAERNIGWVGVIDFGLSFLWSANVQIDLGTSIGVTRMADDINPYLGISFRF